MLRAYVIHFKYQNPGDKAPGPVRQFRIYADSLDEARRLAFIDATEEVFENLARALHASTTPEALGCIIPRPSEDGTQSATASHG